MDGKFVENLPIIVGQMVDCFVLQTGLHHHHVLIEQHLTVLVVQLLYLTT